MSDKAAEASTSFRPNDDKFSSLHFVWWVGFLALCLTTMQLERTPILMLFVAVLFLPPLTIALLVGIIGNSFARRWRRAVSALMGPLLAVALIKELWLIGLDPDRIHFLLVKYPHELQIHFSPDGEQASRSWDWGLDAPLASPGVAYTLIYDPTDSESFVESDSGKAVRSMGDHFYLVKDYEGEP
jgi:hypothetical protein